MKLYHNQHLFDADAPLFKADNRSFRYGDGLFETVRVANGVPFFWPYHMARLRRGICILGMDDRGFNDALLLEQLQHLCTINACANAARVRIAVYRQAENKAAYVIEAAPLPAPNFEWNTKGWRIAVFADVQISMDMLANLKKSSYLPYALAMQHAQQAGLDECLVRNALGNICEGSRTNIFGVKGTELYTPALTEGCVAGVMRRYILDYCSTNGINCHEVPLTETFLQETDELFLTNAIQGMRWVGSWGQKHYQNSFVQQLFHKALATIQP